MDDTHASTPTAHDTHMVSAPSTLDLADQIAALLESTALLQRTAAHLLSQISPQSVGGGHGVFRGAYTGSHVDLQAPQSAQASVLGAGVPIPSRGWQKDHSPKEKIIARTKVRLMKDGWEDCDDTDVHATRLSEAMMRLGMEDMDNFVTEASRLNCSNMAISATLVSAVVATFVANTYNEHDSQHMRVVNGLWLLSLFMSLATAMLCMLVSEWLTWSTSQELRDLSFIYLLIRTAHRSLLMHLSIFLFFAGLMVLMWNESTTAVCIVPTICCGIFAVYYVLATVRAPFLTFFHDVRQFGEDDFRGLRVQIWTPFTLTTHHTLNYIFMYIVDPLRNLVRRLNSPKSSDNGDHRPPLRTMTSEFTSMQKDNSDTPQTNPPPIPYSPPEPATAPAPARSPHLLRTDLPVLGLRARGRSPLSARTEDGQWVDSPHAVSRVGTPISTAPAQTEGGDVNSEDVEFARKLRATRMRRLTEHEFLSPARAPRGATDV